ncbi:transcription factor S-II, central domain-containing protein [Exophiala viscosa]|uniref:transcription factor S-II, central domain-containing protein n=1 Tax=Exophiala viscosa TaxID=2486360 RepID=UPI002195E972|nr:transcription factor S-II, central domain-containing protein [Exophiala viscosa]
MPTMADEPRRSGRATKGQYTKDRDIEEGSTKKKGKGKGSKAKAAEEEQDEEGDEIIRCVCGQYEEEEDVPRAMICCDKCSAWQHNGCMGLPEDYEVDTYFCEQCRPEDHKDLLAAIARGERPWEAALERRQAEARGKKKGKKGRKSGGARTSEVPASSSQEATEATPQPATTGQKRKLEESPNVPELKNKKVRGTPPADTDGGETTTPARKISETPSRVVSKSEWPVVSDVKDLANTARRSSASTLIKLIEQQIKETVKRGEYAVAAGSSAPETAAQLALRLESALYHIHSGGNGDPTEAYKNQLRSIPFNIKKNHALAARLLNGELTPEELAAMDPKDMASDEQKRKDAATIKELEKQHTIVEDDGPRIRRTHKGEEYVDESRQVAMESQTSHIPVRKPSGIEPTDGDITSPGLKSPSETPAAAPRARPSVNTTKRQSSANFDIDKVWSNVQGSPDGEQRFGELPRQSSGVAAREPQGPGAKADADIDELLKDEDAESPPYSPKEVAEADGVVWRGTVNGGNLGRFHATAKFAAGATPESDTLRMTYDQVIPPEIAIGGRIAPAKADEYLCGLEYSNTSDLVIVCMPEPQNSHDQEQFDKLFKYFKGKDRFGVGIQHQNPAIKDIYLIPLDAGQELPTFVRKIETEFPDPTRERMMLVPIVIKNSELPHNLATAMLDGNGNPAYASPSRGGPVAQTPITPHDGAFDMPPQQAAAYGQSPAPGQYGVNGAPGMVPGQAFPPQHYPVSTPTTQHSAQQQAAPPQTESLVNAQKILGPLASSPAVVELCGQVPTAGEFEFRIIKECLEKNPEAGNDLGLLTAMLQQSHAASASGPK